MTEPDLDDLLAGYRQGTTSLDALAAEVERRAVTSPGSAAVLTRQIEDARGDTLDEAAYERLRATLDLTEDDRTRVIAGGTGGRARPATEEPTTAEGEPEDRTRVLPGGTGGGSDTGATPPPVAGDDRTRILPGGTGGARTDDRTVEPSADANRSGTPPVGAGAAEPTTGPSVDDRTRALPGGTGGVAQPVAPPSPREPTAPPAPRPAQSRGEFEAGSVLKDRFRLVEPLGTGGMGTVWKAVDKLKEEARDCNPYVAVKLLSGDFRDHPEAFIALQRESAKQQRLAHPNIATVFDFDRDGETVYMTMEVMTGTPLDQFVASVPAGGLDFEEALPIIEELGAGLAYAHQAGLVHSDLKPGNAFLTDDGHVKLLDFGIARASKTRASAESETTVFDPGDLGALTPSYATIEMFDGQDPDPRDDIYAFAIIAYQLFTGRHPYDRKPAPRAKEMGLVAEPVAKLTRRQNQALLAGLAFDREARIESVETFLDGIRPHRSVLPWALAGALVVSVIIGVLAYKPVMEFLAEREREAIIEVFEAGGQENMTAALAMVGALERPEQRAAVVDDPRVRQAIIDVHLSRSRSHFDPDAERHDYAAAVAVMEELRALYPDSAEVLQLRTDLASMRDDTLGRLAERYGALLAAGRLTPDAEADDVLDVRAIVARIDAEHPLLSDPGLAGRYAEAARAATEAGEHARALELVTTGLEVVGEDGALVALRAQAETALALEAQARRVAELEASLSAASPESLSAFDAVRESLLELQGLRPAHAELERLRARLGPVFAGAFAGLLGAGDTPRAARRLQGYARLLDTAAVESYRGELEALGVSPAPAGEVEAVMEALEALLSAPAPAERGWELRVGAAYRELLALAGSDSAPARSVRERVSTGYLEPARAAREGGRYDEAMALLSRGSAVLAWAAGFEDERAQVEAAREAQRRREEEARRLARIEGLRETLRGHVAGGEAEAASETLQTLRAEVGPDDTFVAEEAPRLIASVYLARGRAAAARGEYEVALVAVESGLAVSPGETALETARAGYRSAVQDRALELLRRRPAPGATTLESATRERTAPSTVAISGGAMPSMPRGAPGAAFPALDPPMARRIAGRVAEAARAAAEAGEHARALELVTTGLEVVGEDGALVALRAQAETALALEAQARRVAELEASLSAASPESLSAFDAVRESLLELQGLRPAHAELERLRARLGPVFASAFAGLLGAGDTPRAARRLQGYARLLDTAAVESYRGELEALGVSPAPAGEVEAVMEALEALLSAPAPAERGWELRVGAAYRELLALAGSDSAPARSVRERVSTGYLEPARAAREGGRYDEAMALLSRGSAVLAWAAGFEDERAQVEAAREAQRRREEEARRLARIEGLRETLRGHVAGGEAEAASETLQTLRAEVGPDDTFVAEEAPGLIAGVYLARGRTAAARGEYEVALVAVESGLAVSPGETALETARAGYRSAVQDRALELLRRRTASAPAMTAGVLRTGVDVSTVAVPDGAVPSMPRDAPEATLPALDTSMAKRIAERVGTGSRGGAERIRALGTTLDGYRLLFPEQRSTLEQRIAGTLGARLDEMARARDVAAHNSLLSAAKSLGLLGGRAALVPPRPSALIGRLGKRSLEAGRLNAARELADRVAAKQPDATNLESFRAAIDRREAQAKAAFSRYRRYTDLRRPKTARRHIEEAVQLWSDNAEYTALRDRLAQVTEVKRGACTAALAGYGKRSRGRCHDEVAGARGPSMVVVPGADGGSPFAIGRTEVTVADFNRYCAASGACAPLSGAGNLPATGMSAEAVRGYALWLTEESGATYRLPTEKEWEHAALANGKPASKDFNCRVARGSEIIKGHSLRRAATGGANAWGLVNYVGNAWEWTSTGSGLALRGGAYTTSLVDCAVRLRKPDAGKASEEAGFRLVREIG